MSNKEPTQMSKDFYVGKTLQGNYLIQRLVGKGGMAWVYKTEHVKFQESMAVKILLPNICEQEEIRQRFLEEARIQFKLKHPHIVQVTDIIEDGPLIAIVMEWVDGENLKQLLRKLDRPISRKDIWRIIAPILDAVGFAHKQNLVHRDIKPANILLHTEGERLVPKIADFGIAKVLDEARANNTATGIMMGTLKFMPPEQIRDSKRVDHRADIYALGATLYVMATRRLPFLGKGDWVIYQQMNEDPAPPSSFNPQLSDDFDHVVLKCMHKDPDQRYQSCAELAQALSLALLDPKNIKRFNTQEINAMDIYNLLVSMPEESSVYSSSVDIMSPAAISPMAGILPSAVGTNPFIPKTPSSKAIIDGGETGETGNTGNTGSRTQSGSAPTDPGQEAHVHAAPSRTSEPQNESEEEHTPQQQLPSQTLLPEGTSANALVFKTAGMTMIMMIVVLLIGGVIFRFLNPKVSQKSITSPTPRSSIRKAPAIATGSCQEGMRKSCYTGPPQTQGVGRCKAGVQLCKNKVWQPCLGLVLPKSKEECNGIDDDCNGQVDEIFSQKGKSCKGQLGDCPVTGKYVCSSNQQKLTCAPSGAPPKGSLQIKIRPSHVAFRMYYKRRKRTIRGTYCIAAQKSFTITLQHRRYYRCVVRVSSRTQQLSIRMKRRNPSDLDPELGYCKR